MHPNIKQFLAAFTNDSKFFLNLPVFWSVTINGVEESAINSVLSYADEKWQAKINPLAMTRGGNILAAQEVVLPNESSEFITFDPNDNSGGFLPVYGLKNRNSFLNRSLSVNFLETQFDIEHNFFRPWMIAVGIKGLIEQGANLKADMEVKQYANSGTFIKGFKFNKVFPTAVESYTLNYSDTDIKAHSITFACQNYEQL